MDTLTFKTINSQRKFETTLSTKERKDNGVFLTNNIKTIDDIIVIIDFDSPDILKKKILEPSCGKGIFLVRIIEKIYKKYPDAEIVGKFINENLFFIDIDERMIETTKKNISNLFFNLFDKQYNFGFNSFIYDFTKRIKPKHNNNLFDTTINTPLDKILGRIDYVVGNPPYVSLYGRRDRKKDENQRVYYLNRYNQFPDSLKNGKINYVMLFIEHSIDFLVRGGELSFIIDIAFFETAYQYTRRFLLKNTSIKSIKYNIKDFEAASGQLIIKFAKKKVKNNFVEIINSETSEALLINQDDWNTPNDQYKFRFNTCESSKIIIDKIHNKKSPSLKQLYPKKNLRTCVMLLNMEDKFVFETIKNNKIKIYPYYQGSKGLVQKYDSFIFSKYFHYDKELQDKINDELKEELTLKGIKNKKRLGLGETIIYDNPKIYIRQSAKEIIASYDENPSSANNSLYVFSLRDNSSKAIMFMKFLCGILNSELITFYAQKQNIIRFSNGKQPQIKVSDLYTIPVLQDVKTQEKISKLVSDIYNNMSDKDKLMKEINELIYDYFEISKEQIEIIRNAIESF